MRCAAAGIFMSEISVLLVDDHSLVRKGFRRILEDDSEIQVVGEACDGVEAVKAAKELKPRVIVMDMAMPGLNGMQACIEILKVLPNTAIIILSIHSADISLRACVLRVTKVILHRVHPLHQNHSFEQHPEYFAAYFNSVKPGQRHI